MITTGNQIEIRHYRYFLALAEQLNYHRAAEMLFISQPGLSRQIKQMEELLGVQLFERGQRMVRLTAAGKYLQAECIQMLNRIKHMHGQLQAIDKGELGQLQIGFLGSAMQQIIPNLLRYLRDKYPSIHTNLREMSNQDQIDKLLDGTLDIGFVRLPQVVDEIHKEDICTDKFVLVLPSQHTLTEESFTSLRQLADESFILFSSDYSPHYYQTIMSIFENEGFSPNVSHQSVHAQTIYKLVEQGLGLAIVPYSLQFGFDLQVKFIPIPRAHQTTTLSAVWLKTSFNPCLGHIIEAIEMYKSSSAIYGDI